MKNGAPAASVLLTVYNEQPVRLEKAITSILRQSFADFEFVIVDDGSTNPETHDCLRRMRATDDRIRLFFLGENRGVAGALNHGLRLVRAPLVFRQDQDDWSDPERFARQIAFLDANPDVAMVGSAVQLYQENGRPVARYVFPTRTADVAKAFGTINPFAHGAVCFRRDLVLGIGGYREDLPGVEDLDLFWRIFERWPAVNLPDVLYHYVLGSSTATARSYRTRYLYRKAVAVLADSRRTGPEMPVADALAIAEATLDCSNGELLAALGDDQMRAGCFGAAFLTYLRALADWPPSMKPLAKLLRLGVWMAMPGFRYRLFREKIRQIQPPRVDASTLSP